MQVINNYVKFVSFKQSISCLAFTKDLVITYENVDNLRKILGFLKETAGKVGLQILFE